MKSKNSEELFEQAIEFAVEASTISANKFNATPNDIRRDAFFTISQDAVITHRAIGTLARSGWVGSTPVLLRTLLDLQISAAAILHSADSRLAAFKYFYSGYRLLDRSDKHFDAEFRRSARKLIRERIGQLPEADRPAALQFLKEKDRSYWFSDEWSNPSQVLSQFAPDLLVPYKRLSSAAHGGFFGMRLFREDPDQRSINAELPAGLRSVKARLTSSRFLVDLIAIRSGAEDLELDGRAQFLREQISLAFAEAGNKRYGAGTA